MKRFYIDHEEKIGKWTVTEMSCADRTEFRILLENSDSCAVEVWEYSNDYEALKNFYEQCQLCEQD